MEQTADIDGNGTSLVVANISLKSYCYRTFAIIGPLTSGVAVQLKKFELAREFIAAGLERSAKFPAAAAEFPLFKSLFQTVCFC